MIRGWGVLLLTLVTACTAQPVEPSEPAQKIRINHLQFVGSHNSYKRAMSAEHARDLAARNPEAARSLDYAHLPLADQLDLGVRKLELDVFYQPETDSFLVGHVQVIDMNSHCANLRACLAEILDWSAAHSSHVPIWISFNAKDQVIDGLPDPAPFDAAALHSLDAIITATIGSQLIWPREVRAENSVKPAWPELDNARGKLLVILDEGGEKRETYLEGWRSRPMFVGVDPNHPASAIQIINDPIEQQALITQRVRDGYMVRTRADADTREARANDSTRRQAAFASGAQAISTDYYLPATQFGNGYVVSPVIRCNPITAPPGCAVTE